MDIGIADNEVALYEQALRAIKGRIDVAQGLLSNSLHPMYMEFSALLLRQVLELIVLASFAANRQAVEAISSQLNQKKYDEARKLAKRANPEYWPVPSRQVQVAPGSFDMKPLQAGTYLGEAEWGPTYGWLSNLLHAGNPWGKRRKPDEQIVKDLRVLVDKLCALLSHHNIPLAGGDTLINGLMEGSDGDVHVTIFRVTHKLDPTPRRAALTKLTPMQKVEQDAALRSSRRRGRA